MSLEHALYADMTASSAASLFIVYLLAGYKGKHGTQGNCSLFLWAPALETAKFTGFLKPLCKPEILVSGLAPFSPVRRYIHLCDCAASHCRHLTQRSPHRIHRSGGRQGQHCPKLIDYWIQGQQSRIASRLFAKLTRSTIINKPATVQNVVAIERQVRNFLAVSLVASQSQRQRWTKLVLVDQWQCTNAYLRDLRTGFADLNWAEFFEGSSFHLPNIDEI